MTVFRRKITDEMQKWKDDTYRCALLIEGAFGVGKTTAVTEFARRSYESFILIDFSKPCEEVRELFRDIYPNHTDGFFEKLESIYGLKLVPGHSVIIFDEVQCFLRARGSLEDLLADDRYDYMETGSHLRSCPGRADIKPGNEHRITMYPMDFEEFLWALYGNDKTASGRIWNAYLHFSPLGDEAGRSAMEDFRKYMLIGGMPQAVAAYMDGAEDGFACAEAAKRGILAQYVEDIAEFGGSDEERDRIEAVFKRLPLQLSERDKTFNASKLAPGAHIEDYGEAIFWLKDAGIISPCCPCGKPDGMLSSDFRISSLKCYMTDTGLLATHYHAVTRTGGMHLHREILDGRLGAEEGMLLENMAAQLLGPAGHRLFFYRHYDGVSNKTDMEADFMIYRGLKICPVELKAGTACGFESFGKLRDRHSRYISKGYVLHTGDVSVKDTVTYLPVYMAMYL